MPATWPSTTASIYAFCSIGCRTRFIKEPVSYLEASSYSPMHD